ncbi:DUF5719 family protein [Ferrimicrobium sp.]|uniref:DUF5719 family protein n=1 Tax=Ferrimicrobium sp. TaxID=2926050 RepID=UPI00261A8F9C|nr:DUF5719 family protein [Ferrimicrobium sp.]
MRSSKVILVAMIAVLIAGVGLTRSFAASRSKFAVSHVPFGIGSLAVPTAVPQASSVSWYCVVPPTIGTIKTDGIVLENPTRYARRLLISSEVGKRLEHGIMLAHSSLHLLVGPGHGRVIVSSGGVVAFVETRTTSAAAPQISPCSSSPSNSWTLEGLSTTTGTRSSISIYNPFKVQAVVDLSYYSSQGVLAVPSVEGLIAKPGAVLTVNAERFAPNAKDIAATVSARSGSVIAVASVASPNPQVVLGDAAPSTRLYLPYVPTGGLKALVVDLVNTSSISDTVTISMAGFTGSTGVAVMQSMHPVERVTVPANSPLAVDMTSIASTTSSGAVAIKVMARRPLFGLGSIETSSGTAPFFAITPSFFHSARWWVSCVANPAHRGPEVVFSRASRVSVIGGSLAGGHVQKSTSTNILSPSVGPIGLTSATPSLYQLHLSRAMTLGTLPLSEGCAALPAT